MPLLIFEFKGEAAILARFILKSSKWKLFSNNNLGTICNLTNIYRKIVSKILIGKFHIFYF